MSAVGLPPNLAVGHNPYVLKDTLAIDWILRRTDLVFEFRLFKLSQKVGQAETLLAYVMMVFNDHLFDGVDPSAGNQVAQNAMFGTFDVQVQEVNGSLNEVREFPAGYLNAFPRCSTGG